MICILIFLTFLIQTSTFISYSFSIKNVIRKFSILNSRLISSQETPNKKERIQKYIARSGIASRRDAERLIVQGKVKLNGKTVNELGLKIHPLKDIVLVNGEKLTLPDHSSTHWIIFHKPQDVLPTFQDEKQRKTISTFIPKAKELHLLSVGALDRDSSGLYLLTNELGWIHILTHPSFQINRKYQLLVQGHPTMEQVKDLQEASSSFNFYLPDESHPCIPFTMEILWWDENGRSLLQVVTKDSRAHLLASLADSLSCRLLRIKRTEFGPLKLNKLKRGEWKELSSAQIKLLKTNCRATSPTSRSLLTSSSTLDHPHNIKKR